MKMGMWVLSSVMSVLVLFSVSTAQATILPENDLWKQDGMFKTAGLTEAEFHSAIDEVINVYEPIVRSFGATLTVERRWSDPTVNAQAEMNGRNWTVRMFGGLARRPEVTFDGMQLVVCHELGHLVGGFPFKPWGTSTEGQSDYFATQECARRVWGMESASSSTLPAPAVKTACDRVWSKSTDQAHCYRASAAGHSLASLLCAIGSRPVVPSFERRDTTVVTSTSISHPNAQCRLDTMFAGALCAASFDVSRVPGRSHPAGEGSVEAERDMAATSCAAASGFAEGLRPTCWFKPRL